MVKKLECKLTSTAALVEIDRLIQTKKASSKAKVDDCAGSYQAAADCVEQDFSFVGEARVLPAVRTDRAFRRVFRHGNSQLSADDELIGV
jgi:hypothetical protein